MNVFQLQSLYILLFQEHSAATSPSDIMDVGALHHVLDRNYSLHFGQHNTGFALRDDRRNLCQLSKATDNIAKMENTDKSNPKLFQLCISTRRHQVSQISEENHFAR